MKKMKKNKWIFLLLLFLFSLLTTRITAQQDSVPAKELVKLRYFNDNNSRQYLVLENLLKTGKKTEPLVNKKFQLFLDSNKATNLISEVTTDKNGKAKSFLPPSLKSSWDASSVHTFLAVASGKEENATELEITKAKIQIDTVVEDTTRNIIVKVSKYENDEWVPANEVEMKVGIARLGGGILSAGDEETYTSDSTGTVRVELTKKNLPGNSIGNIVLVAKAEDNDLYGNLLVEKVVPWGLAVKPDTDFFEKRTLWSTRFKAPIWLLFMAYSIIIAVWGTIIYLVSQIIKIKKLGTTTSASS